MDVAVAVLLVVALVGPAGAAPFPGGDVRYSGAAAIDNEFNPAVAYNPNADQYLVVWQDARKTDTHLYDIWGQRVGGDGSKLGPNIRISRGVNSGEYTPAVAFSTTSNRYLVVWADGRDKLTKGDEIYGQQVRAGGALAGGPFVISDALAVGNETAPAVAWNSNANQYLVVWEDTRSGASPSPFDIWGQRVKAGGSMAGANFRISGPFGPPVPTMETSPEVAFNATSNQYLVVWTDFRNFATRGGDIYGARIKAGGAIAQADIQICGVAADEDDGHADVAWNSNANQYLVTWTDGRNNPARGNDIYARRVKAGGNMAGLDFRVVDAMGLGYQTESAVAFSPDANRYLVTWMDSRDAVDEGNNIYGQWVKAGGATPGNNILISGVPTDSQEGWPDVAYGSAANLHLIVYTDSRNNDTRGGDIYGRLMSD